MRKRSWGPAFCLAVTAAVVAGALALAAPGAIPQAVAQEGSLSVSVAGGAFGGPQVVEIRINDPDTRRVDRQHPDPGVEINGEKVAMVQASTGVWYAYVAAQEERGDLDLGDLHLENSGGIPSYIDAASDAVSFHVNPVDVVRNPQVINSGNDQGVPPGQLAGQSGGLGNFWPFIQVYEFDSGDDIRITYGDESVDLEYERDLADSAVMEVDRLKVPPGGQIHLTIRDFQLNLDPTAREQWVLALDGSAYYFNRGTGGVSEIRGDSIQLFEGETGVFEANYMDGPLEFEPRDAGGIAENGNRTGNESLANKIDSGVPAVLFTETARNSGVFVSYDSDSQSPIRVSPDARTSERVDMTYAGERPRLEAPEVPDRDDEDPAGGPPEDGAGPEEPVDAPDSGDAPEPADDSQPEPPVPEEGASVGDGWDWLRDLGGVAIAFDEESYSWSDRVEILVVAPKFDRAPTAIEYIGDGDSRVEVSTALDTLEIYRLLETGPNTGAFAGSVQLVGPPENGRTAPDAEGFGPVDGRIPVGNVDSITVRFAHDGDRENLILSAPIGWRVDISNLKVVNALGGRVDAVPAGHQLHISADLAAAPNWNQEYAYIIQIQDADGIAVHLSWVTGLLEGTDTTTVSQSWTPDEAGSYTATIFVWDSLSEQLALLPPQSLEISVT